MPARGLLSAFDAAWDTVGAADAVLSAPWNTAASGDAVLIAPWDTGVSGDAVLIAPWGALGAADAPLIAVWGMADAVNLSGSALWGPWAAADAPLLCLWGMAAPLGGPWTALWGVSQAADAGFSALWGVLSRVNQDWAALWGVSQAIDSRETALWGMASPVDSPWTALWGMAEPIDGPWTALWGPSLPPALLDAPWLLWTTPAYGLDAWTGRWDSEQLLQRLFNMSASIIRVSDGANVAALAASVETDLDSFLWSGSGTIIGDAARALVDPSGGPVEVLLTANGEVWPLLIEEVEPQNRTFGDALIYQFKGRSPSAIHAAPYTAPITYAWSTSTSAAQIAAYLFAGTGWSVDWTADDYDIPGGVFSVADKTPLEILKELAAVVGAFVYTRRAGKVVGVRYHHAKNPTAFASGDQDATIHDALTFSESRAWLPRPGYNRVIASGTSAGYTVTSTLDGTAGDKMGPIITHPLILTPQVGRNAGRFFLYENGYNQLQRTRTLPLHSVDYPLMEPGAVLLEPTAGWFAIVQAVRVTVSRESIRQEVTLKEYKP